MTTDPTKDDELLAKLRSLAGTADPVPDDVVLAGRSAIAHRDLDARIAELVEDELAGAGTRGDADPWFTFELDDVVVEFTIHRGEALRLVGQVEADTPTSRVDAHGAAGHTPCPLDDLGRFSIDVEPGPLRLEIVLDDDRRVVTSWLVAR